MYILRRVPFKSPHVAWRLSRLFLASSTFTSSAKPEATRSAEMMRRRAMVVVVVRSKSFNGSGAFRHTQAGKNLRVWHKYTTSNCTSIAWYYYFFNYNRMYAIKVKAIAVIALKLERSMLARICYLSTQSSRKAASTTNTWRKSQTCKQTLIAIHKMSIW